MNRIVVIFGTRPEIIKLAPVIKALIAQGAKPLLIHSNQHYDYAMDQVFMDQLGLPPVDYNLGIHAGTHGDMVGRMLIALDQLLISLQPDVVVVHGDTNTTLAGALSAVKLHIPIAHVEAGMRSYDRTMPEEINRVLVDAISHRLYVPTPQEKKHLQQEGISLNKIKVVGSTLVNSVELISTTQSLSVLAEHQLSPQDYALVTIHRESNTQSQTSLTKVVSLLRAAHDHPYTHLPFIWPMHPRTKKQLEAFKIKLPTFIKVVDPLGYVELISLLKQAKVILTDSGGLQEEAYLCHTPCLTVRDTTEWTYTTKHQCNFLVDTNVKQLIQALDFYQSSPDLNWPPVYNKNVSVEIAKDLLEL